MSHTRRLTEDEIRNLTASALEARKLSYSPYSHYQVGAALLSEDGRVYTGCNIENAAYTPTNCAERTAFFKAVSEGVTSFRAIAVAGSPAGDAITQYAFPCGVCRQVMAEFCRPEDFTVIVAGPAGDDKVLTLAELLPESFGPDNLHKRQEGRGI